MIIKATVCERGRTHYHFTSRGTEYTVIPDGSMYEVWSSRGGYRGARGNLTVQLLTAEETRARAKALAALLDLIESDPSQAQ